MNENIVKLEYLDKEIYLVRTAHVSKTSVSDVDECVNEVMPDSICVELDKDRYNKLTDPEKWRETDIVKIIKNKQVGFLFVNCILASYQKRTAKSMDSTNGAEMIEGIKLAKQTGANLVLADRSIKTTFSRIWHMLSSKEKFNLLYGSIGAIFEKEEVSEEELEKLKEADALEAALLEIGKEFPTVKKVLVDERDQYLAQKIKTAPGKKIVAIIGAAHTGGITRNLDKEIDIDKLDKVVKKKSKTSTFVKWLIPIALIGIIAYTIFNNRELGLKQLKSWILWNGTLASLGSLISLGHPLTILTAFVSAPLTSLSPLIPASGFFAGLVEANIRKPKVKDFEDITDDTATIKGFWKNRVTRILLIVLLTNLFSSLGTIISGIDVVKKFIESL